MEMWHNANMANLNSFIRNQLFDYTNKSYWTWVGKWICNQPTLPFSQPSPQDQINENAKSSTNSEGKHDKKPSKKSSSKSLQKGEKEGQAKSLSKSKSQQKKSISETLWDNDHNNQDLPENLSTVPKPQVIESAKYSEEEYSSRKFSDESKNDHHEINLTEQYQCRYVTQTTSSSRKKRYIECLYNGCLKKFSKSWNFIDHARMHIGIKPYKCEKCDKAFTQKGNLKKHINQHLAKEKTQ